MLKCVFVLLKPTLNTNGCVCGPIVIVKNSIIFRKEHPDHRVHLVTQNVNIVTGSNSTDHSNYRTSRIPRYGYPNHHRSTSIKVHISQLEPGIHDYKLPWAVSKPKLSLMLGTTRTMTHLTILHISSHQTSRFYGHCTIFFTF